jgi:hypothetical protein
VRPQNSKRSERSGKPERRKRRISARLLKRENVLQLPLLKPAKSTPVLLRTLNPPKILPILPEFVHSFLPWGTNPRTAKYRVSTTPLQVEL